MYIYMKAILLPFGINNPTSVDIPLNSFTQSINQSKFKLCHKYVHLYLYLIMRST